MPRVPKTTQPAKPNEVQGRDLFQTPNYATELLVPYIPWNVEYIWEPACGNMKISNVLQKGYHVLSTDLNSEQGVKYSVNFLTTEKDRYEWDAIITNPPFSLKDKFIMRAIEFDRPFAFLIPFAMSKFLSDCFSRYGCQGLVPTSRINYITPSGLDENGGHTSYFHSFWLTRGFGLDELLVFEDITKQQRENI